MDAILDLHIAIARALDAYDDERVAELRDLLARLRAFYS